MFERFLNVFFLAVFETVFETEFETGLLLPLLLNIDIVVWVKSNVDLRILVMMEFQLGSGRWW